MNRFQIFVVIMLLLNGAAFAFLLLRPDPEPVAAPEPMQVRKQRAKRANRLRPKRREPVVEATLAEAGQFYTKEQIAAARKRSKFAFFQPGRCKTDSEHCCHMNCADLKGEARQDRCVMKCVRYWDYETWEIVRPR